MTARKLISLCIPVYDEEDNIEPLYRRIRAIADSLAATYDFEFLFTDNHSTDRTYELLVELAGKDPRVRAIRFSRNFGFQRSVLTNYRNARGDAAIQLDCDLQDPPELMVEFLALWEQGYKVVYGVRRSRPKEQLWLRTSRKAFYRLIDYLSEDHLPHDAGDFRLVDRVVLDYLRSYDDPQPYLRGTIATLGYRQIGVPYDRAARLHGESKFNLLRLISLALDGIFNHSTVPLRIATIIGLILSCLAGLGTLYYIAARLFFRNDWPVGLASSSILILFSIGLNALFLGIIGEYIGRIYKSVKKAPTTIVEQAIDHQGAAMQTGQPVPAAGDAE